jgi:hypothetical protein
MRMDGTRKGLSDRDVAVPHLHSANSITNEGQIHMKGETE